MKRNTEKVNHKQATDKTKPRVDIKTNVKAGACCNSGWSDRNVKENFALVDSLDVLAVVLED
ncbi:MAG: hypothetical protein ETSY1_42965 [Candidatus Entotheonella factor]|uniref:Uncharacterized protein n=1 Tax=Entotheonella factor TaxID=1429438 RepID=W4L4I8_ENTF1|nr:MAG: hypothetical protein ETSY1_42965 [Candidatus Entotheonella factor]